MISSPMVQLFAVIIDRDADRVTEELLRLGVVHFVNVSGFEPERARETQPERSADSYPSIREMKRRIEELLEGAALHPGMFEGFESEALKVEASASVDFGKENRFIDGISEKLQEIRRQQQTVQHEIVKLQVFDKQLREYGFNIGMLELKSDYSLISVRTGIIPQTKFSEVSDELGKIPSVALPLNDRGTMLTVLILFMKRDTQAVEIILKDTGWRAVAASEELKDLDGLKDAESDVAQTMQRRLTHLYEERDDLVKRSRMLIEENKEHLREMWVQLRIRELFDRVQAFFVRTSRTVIFSGWAPKRKQQILSRSIKKATEGHCYLEWNEPKELTEEEKKHVLIPVLLRNSKLFAPFQMLVTRYGIPEYGSIDPTPFVTAFYLIMFGLMFADAGQGVVLALLGIVGMLFVKRKDKRLKARKGISGPKRGDTALLLTILVIWCGCASIVSGLLFGSYFGMQLLPPLWFDFHAIVLGSPHEKSYINDLFDILKLTLYFGIAIIAVGFLFNWINHVLKRRWRELLFSRGGVPGGWIYGGGVYTAWYLVNHDYKALPGFRSLFFLLLVPAVLLLARLFIYFSHDKGKKFTPFTLFYSGMEWLVELLEIVSSYLSNTLSFMRVAGLGIAHASLMIAFFELARMSGSTHAGTAYGVFSILILVFGNILVIGLEGLVAGIQSLRLHYYEFFSKFFQGSGELYSPVGLKSSD